MVAVKAKLQGFYSKLPLKSLPVMGQDNPVVEKISKKLNLKIFILGMLTVVGLHILVNVYISLNADSTISALEDKMQSITVLLDNHQEEDVILENTDRMVIPENIKIDGLTEKTQFGNLPIIRKSDNLTSFRAYSNAFNFKNLADKPLISFVINDYGLSKDNAMAALDILPKEVTFIASPYAHMPSEWISLARDKGHEVWYFLPVENNKFNSTGSDTVFHYLSLAKKRDKFRNALGKASGYVGLAAYTDDGLLTEKEHYSQIAEEVYTRGLGFLDLNPNSAPIFAVKAVSSGAPYLRADMRLRFIRGERDSFESLEALAKKKSHIIVVVDNTPNMIKQLAVWIMRVGQIDYIIAPVSAGYDLPLHRDPHSDNNKH